MGYELTIIYHPKSGDGFDLSKVERKTRRIGKATDPTDDASLAKAILKQYSRRDIFVTDVEVVEFVKKPLRISNSSNGSVRIRGRKYSLEDGEISSDEEHVNTEPTQQAQQVQVAAPNEQTSKDPGPAKGGTVPAGSGDVKALREEVFDPPNEHLAGLYPDFEIGKEYKILAESTKGPNSRVMYTVKSPKGVEVMIPSEFFVAKVAGLSWVGDTTRDEEGVNLGFGSNYQDEMPKLR